MTTLLSPPKLRPTEADQDHATDRMALPTHHPAGGVHHRDRPAISPARPVAVPFPAVADAHTSLWTRLMSGLVGLFAGQSPPSGETSARRASENRLAEYKTRAILSYPRC